MILLENGLLHEKFSLKIPATTCRKFLITVHLGSFFFFQTLLRLNLSLIKVHTHCDILCLEKKYLHADQASDIFIYILPAKNEVTINSTYDIKKNSDELTESFIFRFYLIRTVIKLTKLCLKSILSLKY